MRNELASGKEVFVFVYSVVDIRSSEVPGGDAFFDRLRLMNEIVRNVPRRGGVDNVQCLECLSMSTGLGFGR